MYTESLSSVEITNLFLYGTLQAPTNKDSADVIRPDNTANTAIDVSEDAFMSSGAGRFAVGSRSPIVEKFFNDATDPNGIALSAGTYSVTDLATTYGLSRNFTLDQKGLADGTSDYAERVWVYNNTSFTIDDDAQFTVDSNGTRHIEYMAVRPLAENFDWVGGDNLTGILNVAASYITDPSDLGVKVDITFTGSFDTYSYDNADFIYDNSAEAAQNFGYLNIGDLASLPGDLFDAGAIDFISTDGLAITYGSDGADEILSSYLDGHLLLNDAAELGQKVYLGDGDDIFLGDSFGLTFKIDGGAGDDLADFSDTSDDLTIETIGVEEVAGSDGNDTISADDDAELIAGGDGDDVIKISSLNTVVDGGDGSDKLVFLTPAQVFSVDGAGASVAGAFSATNVETYTGSEFDDTFYLPEDLNSDIDGGASVQTMHMFSGDTASFKYAEGSIEVDIGSEGAISVDGHELASIEILEGSDFADTFTVAEWGSGGWVEPEEVLWAPGGGIQAVRGGGGDDTFDFTGDDMGNLIFGADDGEDTFIYNGNSVGLGVSAGMFFKDVALEDLTFTFEQTGDDVWEYLDDVPEAWTLIREGKFYITVSGGSTKVFIGDGETIEDYTGRDDFSYEEVSFMYGSGSWGTTSDIWPA
jgi:hypothetical protein